MVVAPLRAGVENRHMLEELRHIFPVPSHRPRYWRHVPRAQAGQEVPASARPKSSVGVITCTSSLTRSPQSLMPLGLPLRTRKTMVEV